jgi:hypothetical protein
MTGRQPAPTAPPFLTKTLFVAALECPTRAYYAARPVYASRDDSDFVEALRDGGFLVGALAKCLFPDGREVAAPAARLALEETASLLAAESITLFEPAFRAGDLLARIDILVKEGDTLRLYEVKSKSIDSANPGFVGKRGSLRAEWRPYLFDVAFQTLIVRQACPQCRVVPHLLLPDRTRRATVDSLGALFALDRDADGRSRVRTRKSPLTPADLGESPLASLDVSDIVERILAGEYGVVPPGGEGAKDLPTLAAELAAYHVRGEKPPPHIGNHCKRCPYRVRGTLIEPDQRSGYEECWREALGWTPADFARPHVFDIWNHPGTKKLVAEGIYHLEDLDVRAAFPKAAAAELEDTAAAKDRRRAVQVEMATGSRTGSRFVDPALFAEINGWRLPLHFIDFETAHPVIPLHRGRRPYELYAFQFSCHTAYEDGRVEHAAEWIHTDPASFPNYDFVRALKRALEGDDGTILRYSLYENTVLNTIHEQLAEEGEAVPDGAELRRWIRTVTQWKEGDRPRAGRRNMVDMLVPLERCWYYQTLMGGSNSIKHVLPAVLNESAFLREKYSRPYESANYPDGKIWWVRDETTGLVCDPYDLLEPVNPEGFENPLHDEEGDRIAEGGAAMTAWSRLMFMDVAEAERTATIRALRRYCELDTLAMVMIWEHWRELAGES